MNVAQLLVSCLEAEGVEYIFGVPGEENQDFLFALVKSNIQFIPTRHEQGAAFIANVMGRLTGKAHVCLSTLGPGATNMITGIADAQLDKVPIVALTGQGSTERMHHESHQMIDVVKMYAPITKWNGSITNTAIVTEMTRKAFKVAQAEKPGATHIELPEDVAKVSVADELAPMQPIKTRRPSADPDAIARAAELLQAATRPMILAGNGAIRTRASEAIRAFSEDKNIPVANTFMAKGALSHESYSAIGTVGLGFKDYIIEAFESSDLIIAVGYDIAEYGPSHWNIGETKKIIHIDFDPAEVYTEYQPAVEVVADIASSINTLNELSKDLKCDSWYSEIRERIQHSINQHNVEDGSENTFNAPNVIHAVRKCLPKNGLLISDVGSHKMWIARNYQCCVPNGCLISNGMATMGISLPGLIGAHLVDEHRAVVSIMGDGGAMMNIQELETAVRLGATGVIIILNDNDYGLIKWKQEREQDKSFGTELGNPDFIALAKSFGINAAKPANHAELEGLLTNAIQKNELLLLEIPIETEVNNELIAELDQYFTEK